MPPIRVLLTALSRFRGEIVREVVAAHPDMVLVTDSIDSDALLSGRAADVADVVIVGAEDERLPAVCGPLLYARPRVKVLAMEERGGDVVLYELRPHRVALGNMSAEHLAEVIRGTGRRAAGLEP